jgi:hypothetical protein
MMGTRFLSAAVAAGVTVAVYLYWVSTVSEPRFLIGGADPHLGMVSVGDRDVAVRLINPAGFSRRTLGMSGGCGPEFIGDVNGVQVVVPAHGTVVLADSFRRESWGSCARGWRG